MKIIQREKYKKYQDKDYSLFSAELNDCEIKEIRLDKCVSKEIDVYAIDHLNNRLYDDMIGLIINDYDHRVVSLFEIEKIIPGFTAKVKRLLILK
jgi:hypothetical protein